MTNRRDITDENGQTAVEFALVAPFIVALLLAVIQFAVAFHDYVTITDAARAGARQAIVARFGPGNFDAAKQAVRNSAPGLDQVKLVPQVTDPSGMTPGSLVTVTVTYPYAIDIPLLGITVVSGNLTATSNEELE